MAKETWKTQSYWSLPVYTGDVSGVCSALYELGGMVVMHDPSGCNSTYNTHDEIRWSEMESLIFLSGLTQMDAITGNDSRLIRDIEECAKEFHPAFIAIANSPVPWLIGTDFRAICAQVNARTSIPCFHVETNAMHDYTAGAAQAFRQLARMLVPAPGKDKPDIDRLRLRRRVPAADERIRVNIIGMTPLDFTAPGESKQLRLLLEQNGFEVVSSWAMGCTLEELKRSHLADANLVVSSCGIEAARWLEETFGMPYVAGIPCGAFAPVLYEALEKAARDGRSSVPYLEVMSRTQGRKGGRCVAGEPVTMGSLAADRILTDHEPCSLVPLTETVRGLVPDQTVRPAGELQIREALGCYDAVCADPMLADACREGAQFEELPHFALSGRMYLNRIQSHFT